MHRRGVGAQGEFVMVAGNEVTAAYWREQRRRGAADLGREWAADVEMAPRGRTQR